MDAQILATLLCIAERDENFSDSLRKETEQSKSIIVFTETPGLMYAWNPAEKEYFAVSLKNRQNCVAAIGLLNEFVENGNVLVNVPGLFRSGFCLDKVLKEPTSYLLENALESPAMLKASNCMLTHDNNADLLLILFRFSPESLRHALIYFSFLIENGHFVLHGSPLKKMYDLTRIYRANRKFMKQCGLKLRVDLVRLDKILHGVEASIPRKTDLLIKQFYPFVASYERLLSDQEMRKRATRKYAAQVWPDYVSADVFLPKFLDWGEMNQTQTQRKLLDCLKKYVENGDGML